MASINKLYNCLADMLVVIGINENTGLKQPTTNWSSPSVKSTDMFCATYEPHVLGALTGTSAIFPQALIKMDANYPPADMTLSPGVASPTEAARSPSFRRRSTRRFSAFPLGDAFVKRRSSARRMTLKTPAQAPISTEIVNSLTSFCFPDGARVYEARPDEEVHYLVLTDIMGNRTYATCLTMYLQYIATPDEGCENDFTLHPHDANIDDVEEKEDNVTKSKCYVPLCMVVISQTPYFIVMKDCLSSIVPKVHQRPDLFTNLVKDLAIRLTMTPTPPAGSLILSFDLFGSQVCLTPPAYPGKDVVDLPLSCLFNCFTPETVLEIMAAILTSQRIVFLSSDYALLTLTTECLLTLLLPFKWRVTYAPVLPFGLLDLIEAPGTYILGCHSRYSSLVHEVDGIVIVDVDEGTVTVNSRDVTLPSVPKTPATKFVDACLLYKRHYDVVSYVTRSACSSTEAVQMNADRARKFNARIVGAALELMVDIFSAIMPYIKINMNIFNRVAFYQSLSVEDKTFYEEVFATDMFSVFLRDRFKQKRDYWSHLYEKSRPGSRGMSVDAAPIESSATSSNHRRSHRSNSLDVLMLPYNVEATTFQLPAFVKTGPMASGPSLLLPGGHRQHEAKHFYDRCILRISRSIQETMSASLRASYLCLRGLLYVAQGKFLEGLEDLHNLTSTDNRLFPLEIVEDIMTLLSKTELDQLQKKRFYKMSKLMSGLCLPRPVDECDDIITEFTIIPDDDVGFHDFCERIRLAEIVTDHETLVRLYEALTVSKGPSGLFEACVDPLTFVLFYEIWKENDAQCQSMAAILMPGKLEAEESVLKVSGLIKTDLGTGRLVLTTKRIYCVQQDAVKEISLLRNIQRVVKVKQSSFFTRSSLDVLKIFQKNTEKLPCVVCLKRDCDLWYTLINEMWSGVLIAESSRDADVTSQAACNVLLADAVIMSGLDAESAHHSRVNESVKKICYLSEQRRHYHASHATTVLLQTIHPSKREDHKTAVESLLCTMPCPQSKRGQLLWCGLGSGKIKVYDVGSWKLESDNFSAKKHVVCLLEVGRRHVWAASFDMIIYVIDMDTKTCHQTLIDHNDMVSHLAKSTDGKEVYSAGMNGHIIVWDAERFSKKHQIHLDGVTALRALSVQGGVLWCGTRTEVLAIPQTSYLDDVDAVIECSDDNEVARLMHRRGKKVENVISRFIIKFDEVWAASSRSDYVVIFDKKSMEVKGEFALPDCSGITAMAVTDTKVWLGSQHGHIFIVDFESRRLVRTLDGAHRDALRSICVSPNGMVIVGGGGVDAKVTIWSSMAEELTDIDTD